MMLLMETIRGAATSMIEGTLLIAVLLLVVVAVLFVHELGHLVVARYFGMKVLSLKIGFGPQVISFTDRLGTDWTLNAFLIGGSCTYDEDDCGTIEQKRLEINVARRVLGRRAVLYAAGPIFNLILAGLFWLLIPVLCSGCTLNDVAVGSVGAMLFRLVAQFSLATALFNLLPLLPLDGGRLCLVGIEAGLGHPVSQVSQKWFFVFSTVLIWSSTLAFLSWALSILSRNAAIQ